MEVRYEDVLHYVQQLGPTWRRERQVTCAQVVVALLERASLCLSEVARAMPKPEQSLHGRLKRLGRWLENPYLDELEVCARWLWLSYECNEHVPGPDADPMILPVLLDTVYFEPFAALLATVPYGSRGLPICWTTYHRYELAACFPPEASWLGPWRWDPQGKGTHSAAQVTPFLSQNHIEEHLLDLLWNMLSPGIRAVIVADRGFARATLYQWCVDRQRDCVIRMDKETHVVLPGERESRRVDAALPVRRGEQRWQVGASYQHDARVPVNLLAMWAPDAEEPWYLATTLDRPDWTATLYTWRMRCETTHRDAKRGVLLRWTGDQHRLTNVLHLHRMLLAVLLAEWWCALVGLQAFHDLPTARPDPPATTTPLTPPISTDVEPPRATAPAGSPPADDPRSVSGTPPAPAPLGHHATPAPARPPAQPRPSGESTPPLLPAPTAPWELQPRRPPAPLPHRGPTPPVPSWMRRFASRGWLSYPRLGWEVLRAPDLGFIVRRAIQWLARCLSIIAPHWSATQLRYRRHSCSPPARAA